MSDISIYFTPPKIDSIKFQSEQLYYHITLHTENSFPELTKPGVAIIFVPEHRTTKPSIQSSKQEKFRTALFSLYRNEGWNKTIYDLGDILPGAKIEDTFFALSQVMEELAKHKITPIIVGGSQDLTIALYKGYKDAEQYVNITTIDAKLNFGDIEQSAHSEGWVSHVLLQKPCYLFNFTAIGIQSHYCDPKELHLFEQLYFDTLRLGEINQNMAKTEPYLRNTDLLSFDLDAIRQSDLPRKNVSIPNGLYANEGCQLAKYAGMSDKLSCFGIFNYNISQYTDESINEIVAQLIWYFLDGYFQRKNDFPVGSKKNYTKFRVFFEEQKEEILFYKSDKSQRWWMEVPYPNKGSQYKRHHMVPCSYNDYQLAMKGDIPDLWWKTYQKLA